MRQSGEPFPRGALSRAAQIRTGNSDQWVDPSARGCLPPKAIYLRNRYPWSFERRYRIEPFLRLTGAICGAKNR
jgi:hypothetical protein